MPIKTIPAIGTRGLFELATPFDKMVAKGVEYSCKAIRRLSDYLANNEDPYAIIYEPQGISDDIFKEDMEEDAYIICLQSRKGHWLYVPYRYVLSYADGSGVQYHSVMLNFSLPSIPVDLDLTGLQADIQELIKGQLGVNSVSNVTETSKIVLVPLEDHLQKNIERDLNKTSPGLFARLVEVEKQRDALLQRNVDLENFIKIHHS